MITRNLFGGRKTIEKLEKIGGLVLKERYLKHFILKDESRTFILFPIKSKKIRYKYTIYSTGYDFNTNFLRN